MFIRSKCVLGVIAKDGTCPIYPGCTAEVDDAEGKRAVESGYAVEVNVFAAAEGGKAAPDAKPGENPSAGESACTGQFSPENGMVAGHLDAEQLQEMSFADLKSLAKDMGIDTGKIRSKAGLIAAIVDIEVFAEAEDPGEAPPVFDAQDVIEE